MRGTISLKKYEPGFLSWLTPCSKVAIKIDNKEIYQLKHQSNIFGGNAKYTLFDKNKLIVKQWRFKSTFKETSLIISLSPKLSYIYNSSSGYGRFITHSEEIQASLKLVSNTRKLELEGMEFKHKDFESVIHFRCPDEMLHTAIIIADLLLTPPYNNNS